MSTQRADFLNASDFARKTYLFALRLFTSAWARRQFLASVRRRLDPGIRSDTDRITKWTIHPFDRENGTDTSGQVAFHELRSGSTSDAYATAYLGCEPGVLRRVIAALPERQKAAWIDLGCGKGRALIVASEFEFPSIVGVELSPQLIAVAKANAGIIKQRFPHRCEIKILQEDAAHFAIPKGQSVIYMFHPFERPVMKKVVRNCERAIRQDDCQIFIVYVRPIFGSLLDESPYFERYLAEMIPVGQIGSLYAEGSSETVVVWRGTKDMKTRHCPDSSINRRIRVDGLDATLERSNLQPHFAVLHEQ